MPELSHASPNLLYARLREQLEASVDSAFREGQRAFFQDDVDTWGVRSDAVKQMARDAWKQMKHWPAGPRNRLCTLLWESGKLEEGVLVVYLYERLASACGRCEFKLFERWVDRYVRNWAHCDGVGTKLIAASIANDPALIAQLGAWTRSRNRWKRRAAAVCLIPEAKHGRHLGEMLAIADALLPDEDDMVRKGVGWLLKEVYPAKPAELASYWESRAGAVPALTLRIASEKMPAPLRERLRRLRNQT